MGGRWRSRFCSAVTPLLNFVQMIFFLSHTHMFLNHVQEFILQCILQYKDDGRDYRWFFCKETASRLFHLRRLLARITIHTFAHTEQVFASLFVGACMSTVRLGQAAVVFKSSRQAILIQLRSSLDNLLILGLSSNSLYGVLGRFSIDGLSSGCVVSFSSTRLAADATRSNACSLLRGIIVYVREVRDVRKA